MNISLTPELESAVQAEVASGRYTNASEVIRVALCKFLLQEVNQRLVSEGAIGFAQLQAGQTVEVKSVHHFRELTCGTQRSNLSAKEDFLLMAPVNAPEMNPAQVRRIHSED